jgi:hypothetical protein
MRCTLVFSTEKKKAREKNTENMNGSSDVTRQGNVAPGGVARGRTWMEACTIPCGRIAGIPVRYHRAFFFVCGHSFLGRHAQQLLGGARPVPPRAPPCLRPVAGWRVSPRTRPSRKNGLVVCATLSGGVRTGGRARACAHLPLPSRPPLPPCPIFFMRTDRVRARNHAFPTAAADDQEVPHRGRPRTQGVWAAATLKTPTFF